MILPEHILSCLTRLEDAGFPTWAVGGCVRDDCLGLPPADYDLCTQALPEQTEQLFSHLPLLLIGKKHGTVTVITSGGPVEITTFRTEGAYTDRRHPDWVAFVPRVEQDLARRDYTINAMAFSPTRGIADPFCGRKDLEDRVLRAVGDPEQRFREDALRILRGIRFSVRYGLTPEPHTFQAMQALSPLMDTLSRERVYGELCGILPLVQADDLLRWGSILAQVIPELRPTLGFDQHSPHHAYDLFTHIAHVTAGVGPDLSLRWAALLHDIGKIPTFTQDADGRGHFYGHAQESARMADQILRRLKAPNALRQEVVLLVEQHMTRLTPDRKLLRRWAGKLGWDGLDKLLLLQEADMGSKGTGESDTQQSFSAVRTMLAQLRQEEGCMGLKHLAVNGNDLMALGLQGKAIGQTLQALLDGVLEETLPNEKTALLQAAAQMIPEQPSRKVPTEASSPEKILPEGCG